MPPPKSSKVWNHFTSIGKKAKCGYCSVSLAYNANNGTGNLVRHMKRKHSDIPIHHDKLEILMTDLFMTEVITASNAIVVNTNTDSVSESAPSTSTEIIPSTSAVVQLSTTPKKPKVVHKASKSVKNCSPNSKSLPIHRSKQIDYQLLKMIVKGYHPFKIVEDPEFRNLINLLCPTYNIPTRKTVSCSVSAIRNELKEEMQALLKPGTAVCLTADGWTSQNNQNHFYAITAHFIDENTILQNVLLDCIHYQDQYTAENISDMLKNVVSEWGLEQNVIAIVTDNASNMLEAIKNLGWQQIKCMAHSLNLAVNSGLQQQEIKSLIIKIKNTVEYFKQNSHALSKLEDNAKKLNLPTLKLKQNCETRWNSTLDMLIRFHTLKYAIITTLAIENPELNNLSDEEWEIISKCTEVLHIFQIVTESLCSEKHVSLSKVPIYVSSMLDNLSKQIKEQKISCIKELCKTIQREIHTRFGSVEKQELIAQATLLDPRIKSHGLSPQNAEKAIAHLKQACARITLKIDQNHRDVNRNNEDSYLDQRKSQSLLWGNFDQKVKNLIAPQNPTESSIIEIEKYLNENLLDRTADPLTWWKQQKYIYPYLYEVMRKRLCITATSVPCERIFSKMSQTVNDRRSRLTPEKTSNIIFLAHNLK